MNLITDIDMTQFNFKILDNNINSKMYLIHHESVFFMVWNLLLAIILIIIVCVMPIELVDEGFLKGVYIYNISNLLFEWFFLIDIFINFITV